MSRYRAAFLSILWDADLIGTRFTLAVAEILWAVMLFWPGDTFGRPTYSLMAATMPEHVWAMTFLITGFLQIAIILRGKYHCRDARIFAFWSFLLWNYTVVSMLLSVYPPPAAIGGEVALALSSWWVWLRPYILADVYRKACHESGFAGFTYD